MKLPLTNISSGYNAIIALNDNFDKLMNELQEKVLYRDNPSGEPNQMENSLDMNSNDILNIKTLQVQDLTIDGTDPTGILERALNAVTEAEGFAEDAAESAEDAINASNASLAELDSRAYAISSFSPNVAPNKIRVAGYSAPGDGGGALYKKVVSEPSHAGKFSITLADTVTVVWYEIAETEIDPLMIDGADDGEKFQNALEFAEFITLNSSHEYLIPRRINATRPVVINTNEAVVRASPGFTDPQLFRILSADVKIKGRGIWDGSNLPAMTGNFVGTDFTGATIYKPGPIDGGMDLSGIEIDGQKVISGELAAIIIYNAPGLKVHQVSADGIHQNTTFDASPTMFFNVCHSSEYDILSVVNRGLKGVAISNSNGWRASNLYAHATGLHTKADGHAGVFFVGCDDWVASNLISIGGYGFKADDCINGQVNGLGADCGGTGVGGAIIQACTRVNLNGGWIKNPLNYGISHSIHTSPLQNCVDCKVSGFELTRFGTVKGDASWGIYVWGNDTHFTSGIEYSDIVIFNFDMGFRSQSALTNAFVDRITLNNVRMRSIKTALGYGPVRDISIEYCKATECPELSYGWRIWNGRGTGKFSMSGGQYEALGSGRFLLLTGDATTIVQYDIMSIDGPVVGSTGGFLSIDINSASSYIKSLTINGVTARGGASASAMLLDSLSSTTMQVNITGNTLLAADGVTKQTIDFVQDAVSGKFNGIVENNMATINNKPNNV